MFLSIIISIYNKEAYLGECLDSILAQNCDPSDYEIVCVNDGSTDGSLALMQTYQDRSLQSAGKLPQIQIVNKENGGLSSARNAGIEASSGEYIWLADADDMIVYNAVKLLREKAQEAVFDRIVFNHYAFRDVLSDSEKQQEMSGSLTQNTDLTRDSIVWSCVWRRAFLLEHGLRFRIKKTTPADPTHMQSGEDLMFNYEFNKNPHSLGVLDNVLYLYRKNPDSITGTVNMAAKTAKMNNFFQLAISVKEIYDGERISGGATEMTANKLMEFLRKGLRYEAQLNGFAYRFGKQMLKDAGLYPFPQPPECTFTPKDFAAESNAMQMGDLHTWLLYHANTRWGLAGLTAFYRWTPRLRYVKRFLSKVKRMIIKDKP